MTLPNNQHNALPFLTPQTTNRFDKGEKSWEKGVGRGGEEEPFFRKVLPPSPHLHPYPFILIITSAAGNHALERTEHPLDATGKHLRCVKGLSPTD